MQLLFIGPTRIGDAVLSSGVLAWMLARWPDARLTVAAGPAAAPRVVDSVPAARRIDLAEKLDLLTAAACLGRATLFVGNDSGLMHLAAAMGVPTLGLFGP